MRISVAMYTGFFSIILLVAILCSIISYSSYSDSVQQNLEESMEFAVQMLRKDYEDLYNESSDFAQYMEQKQLNVDFGSRDTSKTVPERQTAQLKENFVKYLTTNLNSNITDLEVKIYGADANNGILSAEVTAVFQYSTGAYGKVSSYKTVILDKYLKNDPTKG